MKNFLSLTRAYSLPMSLVPLIAAICCAMHSMPLDFLFVSETILLVIAICALHLGGNLFDDYMDVMSYLKKGVPMEYINFTSKIKAAKILDGTYSLDKAKNIAFALFGLAFLIGCYFVYKQGFLILPYMLIGAILLVFYPISSKFAMSELIICILFGPVLINGAYYALTGNIDLQVYTMSISVGIMTAILAITHSLMQYEADVKEGKKTLPILLHDKNLTINLISILILLSYAILAYTVAKFWLTPLVFVAIVLTLPLAVKLVLSLYDFIQIKDVKFVPKWYFGPMENWQQIQNSNFAYFMYRIYLARNLSAVFGLTLAAACLAAFVPAAEVFFGSFGLIQIIY